MIAHELLLADDLTMLYRSGTSDPDFAQIIHHFLIETDTQLADLIEADGRLRLRLKKPVTLDRYLRAIPDLPERYDPLDAAIDMALRALARTGRADEQSIEELIARFPQLGSFIRDAAALNHALWSTAHIQKHHAMSAAKELPCGFGPVLQNGVHRYELRELLGEGAFGQVYLAVDRQLSEKDHPALVCIKVLPGDDRSAWTRQQLIDEATKARRIGHPRVVRVLDRGVSDQNQDFLVYEFVEGGDLAKWARRRTGTRDVGQAVRLITKMARGVHAAHMAGLVHCDLKPNNIVLTTDGEPKVADFGIAIRVDDQSNSCQMNETQLEPPGNLAFMSPEQYRMEPGALTIPTDVYALGGILYWLLTGILPNGSTPLAIRCTHDPIAGRSEPPPLRSHCPEADRDLEAICQRAMAIRPEGRFNSAADLAESLEAWLRREPISWAKPSLLRRLTLWTRRKPTLAAASVFILVILLASGGALQHLASVAGERRFQAAVAEARLEEEERARRNSREILDRYIAQLAEQHEKEVASEVLLQIWLAEWLYGPTVLGDGPGRFDLWEMRVDVVRNLLEKAKASGGDHVFHTLLWESTLGFWLIKDKDYREAEPLMAENYAKWQALLDREDPWLVHLEAMRTCAVVNRLADERDDSESPHGRPQELFPIASTLEQADQMLSADIPGSPLHLLVLSRMRRLYEPDLLDRPQRMREVEERLQTLSE
ncbi:MAG: serine/threonine protein kinase [Planctomycetes bacterium]|nr:serine/threonine protein kinase [Planctomycetota bacterium]